MVFYLGTHQVNHAKYFDRCILSANRLRNRRSSFIVNDWILDSGAFSNLLIHGKHIPLLEYVNIINRFKKCGKLKAVVIQDWMCEDIILKKTELSLNTHLHNTVRSYIDLKKMQEIYFKDIYIMPVLQGYSKESYLKCLNLYGDLLLKNQCIGLGSICKRNKNIKEIQDIIFSIKKVRPDLNLHGFGLKYSALMNQYINDNLYSADSMAWSFAARYEGKNANDWRLALNYMKKIEQGNIQLSFDFMKKH